jgi:threonylcarbamoyladenosine tRNA methylthiotransferase MtaB
MKTVAITTLGCKVNQFESEALMDALEQRGYALVPFGEDAEIMIINTCTVTHRADFESRQMVRRAFRSNPKSLIIVTGCYPQVDPSTFEKMKEVRFLIGNREKNQIPELLPLIQKGDLPRTHVGDMQEESFF